MPEPENETTVIGEAAKRLALELDKLSLGPLPQPGMALAVKRGSREQSVRLMRAGSGQWHGFWMWEPLRTQDAREYEQGLTIGREHDMARLLLSVLEVAEAGEEARERARTPPLPRRGLPRGGRVPRHRTGLERVTPRQILCSAVGLLNLRKAGGTVFFARGGSVLTRPGMRMVTFAELQEGDLARRYW
ncbi:hypothetical protein [Nocardiopsis akebiae]|uniref:hypothetical protein n=1 Tax=Nocardiopsis akebiae TaxID=2831968 RepID=UPI002015E5C6|nr:hypothetical protein [Nocardiopsis akebiae]